MGSLIWQPIIHFVFPYSWISPVKPHCSLGCDLMHRLQKLLPGRSKLSKMDIEQANEEETQREHPESPYRAVRSPMVMYGRIYKLLTS